MFVVKTNFFNKICLVSTRLLVRIVYIFIYFLIRLAVCCSLLLFQPGNNNGNKCFHFHIFLIYTTIGEPSSKCDEFLAVRSQFDSDHGVGFAAPTFGQSATFVRPLFVFYCPLFFTGEKNVAFRHFLMFMLRD